MFIRNLKDTDVLVIGVSIAPDELMPIQDLGTKSQLVRGADEILQYIENGDIQLEYADGDVENSHSKIVSILNSNFSIVEINNEVDIDSSKEIRGNNFYYNSLAKRLAKGESIDITFKGFLKNTSITVQEGEIEFQIISPKMNKIIISEFSTYDIDSEFNIQDPSIRISASVISDVSIYMDGVYFDETGTKTKEQYLNEIYGEDLPAPVIKSTKEKIFDVDLLNSDLNTDTSIDNINHTVGLIKVPLVDNIFTKKTVLNFKNIFNVTENEDWTHSFWFYPTNLSVSRYIAYKSGLFYIYQSRSNLYVNYDNKMINVGTIQENKWYHLVCTYSKNSGVLNYYINGAYTANRTSKPSFSNKTSDFLIGNLSYISNNYGFEGKMGIISEFNYHMSAGMVRNLFKKQNPLNIVDTNLIPSINMRYFNTSNRGNNPPDSKQEFDIVEKEYSTISNLLFQEYIDKIDFMVSKFPNVTSREKYTNIATGIFIADVDGYYKFKIQGDGSVDIVIDDRLVLSNYGNNSYDSPEVIGEIYLTSGYHDFKYRHFHIDSDSVFYAYSWNYNNSSWDNIILYKKDTEDTESTSKDSSKLIEIKDWESTVPITTDSYKYKKLEENSIKYLEFKGKNACKLDLSNIPKLYNESKFTISFAYYIEESKEHFIFGYGKNTNWNDWIMLKGLRDGTLELNFCGEYKRSSKTVTRDKWSNIDIVCDGINITLYIDSEKNIEMDYNKDDWYNGDDFWFNRLSSGSTWIWSESTFRINDFVWYKTNKSEEELQASFINKYT